MLPVLTLLAVSGGFSALHYLRRGYILQLGIYFNVCALAYMAFGLTVARASMASLYAVELEQIGWMCVAAVIGFNAAYLLAGVRQRPVSMEVTDYLPSHTTLLFVAGGALAFEVAAILLIGPLDFLLADRLQRFVDVSPRKVQFYFANFINVCLPIVLARYLNFGHRRDRTLLYLILVHNVSLGLFTISRYDLAIVVLCVCYFLERSRTIGPIQVVGILAFAFLTTAFFKPVLYDTLLGQSYGRTVDLGEFTNWVRNTVTLMTRPDTELPHNGYALALKSLFVAQPEEDALSEWFFQEFFYERAVLFPGLSYGFSGVWEGYLANGLTGVALQFAFFGACFGWLERRPTAMRQVFIVFALVLTYRLFRSEVYNFVKTYAWYFAYPAFAIVFVDKFMMWASGRGVRGGRLPDRGAGRLRRGPAVRD